MITLLNVIFQFVVHASDPHWTCAIVHRDPGIAGTSYFYCLQIAPNGIEVVSVGKFVPDVRAGKATP